MTDAIVTNEAVPPDAIGEFLDLAQSANVYFEIVHDHLTIRAVNPRWEMWKPIRYLLDEIGQARIEAYVRARPN